MSKIKKLSDLVINKNIKIAKELGFSGKKITTIPIPKPKVDWRHKKDIKYQQTYEVQKGTPAKHDKIAEETRMVVHDLSERLGFNPNKLNDVQYGRIYDLMKKHGHKDSLDGRPFAKEKVSGGFKNLNIFGKSTGYGTPQRYLTEEGKLAKISPEKRDSIKAFRPFFKRGYDMEEMGADPLSRYQRRFGPDAYYKLREPFVELNLKSKDLTKKYEKELFDVLEGEDALARLYPEEYIKFLNAGRDLRLLFKLDRVAARKIAQFMNQFKMSVAHSFPADFVKTKKGKGLESLPTRFVSRPDEFTYIHPGYLNYKLSPHEHNAALKWLSGQNPTKTSEAEAIEQLGGYMKFPTGEEIGMHPLQKYGDYDTAIEEAIELIRKSQWMKAGKPPYYNEGGIVNGYSKGGKVKKLLDDALGMMSRRKFLKGMGATAASSAVPKGLVKLAPEVVKKGAMNFAPPWVNGMLSALKQHKDLGTFNQAQFNLRHKIGGGLSTGNDAKILNLGSTKIKVYKDQEATITSFKIKTSDEKAADDIATSQGVTPRGWWDDVELREEPGQKTITFKNQSYDGNDQHIVIDTKNQETRFIDDNWQMEAGGGDIAKDNWKEWLMTPNKNEIKVALKKPLSEIDDAMVDGYSVTDMEEFGMHSYVDSFSPSGNIFGTVERMVKKIKDRKKLDEQRKLTDESREKDMMDWEGQFRGGQGIHGYYRGGMGMKDYPQQNQIRPKPKPAMRRPDNWNMENILDSMGFVESTNRPNVIGPSIEGRKERAHGMFQIMPSTARKPGYGVTPWTNFSNEWRDPIKQRDFAKRYLQALVDHYEGDWFKALSQYGGDSSVNYWNKIVSNYNKGGIARRPNAVPPTEGPDPYANFIKEGAAMIKADPSKYVGASLIRKFNKGGFVKRTAPKVIGKLTNYKPQLVAPESLKKKFKAVEIEDNYWTVFDEDGLPIKDFNKEKAARDFIRNDEYADMYTIGKGKPRQLEPEQPEQPGAMFWGSREKIIGAPSEAMTGTQWLQYMKIGKHGILNPKGYPIIKDMELNDTSLAPWLSRMGNKTISKDVLVKQFDEMAPTMDVTVLGEATGGRIIQDLSRKLKTVDTQAIRDPAIKGFFDYVKAVLPQLKESTTDDAAKGILKGIDDMVFNNFGVKDALTEGVPQRFPFEMKEVLQSLSTALGRRTAGFKEYTRTPQHRGTQMMKGGDNYREFLFRHKPGSLRQNEPSYKYAHDFNLSSADRAGGVVHTRTSDRADQFGRRLLHIEEIQSDMHQQVNAAQRRLKKKHADWAKEGKTPEGEYAKMNERAQQDYDELVASSKYAPRLDLKEEIGTANEQHLALIAAKIEDILARPQDNHTKRRLVNLRREQTKVRKMIQEEKAKAATGEHSGIPQGPLSKTEDYNEFIMKYMLKVAREGGYDGITINTPAIKNLNMSSTSQDYKGNLVAYGPMAKGAMEKAAKKSGAKFLKTVIVDSENRAWEVPMILIKENKAAQAIIDKGLPIYKKGGVVKK